MRAEVVARLPEGSFVPLSTIGGIAPPSLVGPRFSLEQAGGAAGGGAAEAPFAEFETRELQVTARRAWLRGHVVVSFCRQV